MRNEFEVADFYQAALFRYLGYNILKVEVTNQFENAAAKFLFEVPKFDAEIVLGEFANKDTSVSVQGFVKALEEIKSYVGNARTGMGIWTAARYREMRP